MSATTFEGIVEKGRIKIDSDVNLPEGTKVFVVVPDIEMEKREIRLNSPRLAHPEQAADFEMEVVET
jgi:predicted DNA-binding antitoxin AbrB/MazE fold protein